MQRKLYQLIGSLFAVVAMGSGAAFADAGESTTSDSVSNVEVSQSVVSTQSSNPDSSTVEVKTSSEEASTSVTEGRVQTVSTSPEPVLSEPTADQSESSSVTSLQQSSYSGNDLVPVAKEPAEGAVEAGSVTQFAGIAGYKAPQVFASDINRPTPTPATAQPVGPAPQDTPLGGMLESWTALSEASVPSAAQLFSDYSEFVVSFTAVFVVLVSLALLFRAQVGYTAFLRLTGFLHAPRSDATVALQSATPLKWVVSSVPAGT